MKKPYVLRYPNLQKCFEQWGNEDYNLHREDGPALTEWLANGVIVAEGWYYQNKPHRIGGPALKTWFDDSSLWAEEWMVYGKYHRDNGPAKTIWSISGCIRSEEWWMNGKNITLDIKKLNISNPPTLEDIVLIRFMF